jgi:AcrR family transcriptional regulator
MPGTAAKGPAPRERSAAARARLLAAASELFYAEGVHSVGIDRVIEHAGVAKATLYSAFGSKEELVRAYLRARHAATMQRMSDEVAGEYRAWLHGLFSGLAQKAGAADPGSLARQLVLVYDGAGISAWMDRDRGADVAARAVAAALVNAAIPAGAPADNSVADGNGRG